MGVQRHLEKGDIDIGYVGQRINCIGGQFWRVHTVPLREGESERPEMFKIQLRRGRYVRTLKCVDMMLYPVYLRLDCKISAMPPDFVVALPLPTRKHRRLSSRA